MPLQWFELQLYVILQLIYMVFLYYSSVPEPYLKEKRNLPKHSFPWHTFHFGLFNFSIIATTRIWCPFPSYFPPLTIIWWNWYDDKFWGPIPLLAHPTMSTFDIIQTSTQWFTPKIQCNISPWLGVYFLFSHTFKNRPCNQTRKITRPITVVFTFLPWLYPFDHPCVEKLTLFFLSRQNDQSAQRCPYVSY